MDPATYYVEREGRIEGPTTIALWRERSLDVP
jgi:hypothetical protein